MPKARKPDKTEPESNTTLEKEEQQKAAIAESLADSIAGLVLRVPGVNKLSGRLSTGFSKKAKAKAQAKRPRKGVRVTIREKTIYVSIQIMVDFGKSIPDIARQIQKETKEFIDKEYTDYQLSSVNIRVDGFQFSQDSIKYRDQAIKALEA